jgi:hypothetical protein
MKAAAHRKAVVISNATAAAAASEVIRTALPVDSFTSSISR